jgi:hypothetical protein
LEVAPLIATADRRHLIDKLSIQGVKPVIYFQSWIINI